MRQLVLRYQQVFALGLALFMLVPGARAEEMRTLSSAEGAAAPPAESANAYFQATYIWQRKHAFPATYTNLNGTPNSLLPDKERSFTTTATGFFGWRAWQGGELYFAPEIISELPLSGLRGLAGSIQNGELEKNGMVTPTLYQSRLFLRQPWGLGGESIRVELSLIHI